MKVNNKGTTLIEIMVSIILISIVMIFLFNILVDLKEENQLSSKRSTDSINRAAFIRIIQNDLINYGLKGITTCNNGIFCLNLRFDNNQVKKFIIEANSVIYDGERWNITSGNYIRNNIKILYKVGTNDNSILSNPEVTNYHLLKIIIPSTQNTNSNRKFDVELTHVGNKALQLDCNALSNYIGANNVECINASR